MQASAMWLVPTGILQPMSPEISVQLQLGSSNGNGRTYCYRIAAANLFFDCSLTGLASLEQPCPGASAETNWKFTFDRQSDQKEIYHGLGFIGNQWRKVSCWSFPWGFKISLADIGVFGVSGDGKSIVCIERERTAGIDLIAEATLGPALITALALHAIWCLHASAVVVGDQAIAFMGESGQGKSTLARWLNDQNTGNLHRLVDDILPVSPEVDGLHSLPHFPQLKLPARNQPSTGYPERVPLAAVYVLDRPADGDTIEVQPLGRQEGALALVRHTVASRLFDGDLLVKHLDFCVQAASQVPVRKLIYPLTLGALPLVLEVLLDDIQAVDTSAGILIGHNTSA